MPRRADQTSAKPEINQIRLKVMGHRLIPGPHR